MSMIVNHVILADKQMRITRRCKTSLTVVLTGVLVACQLLPGCQWSARAPRVSARQQVLIHRMLECMRQRLACIQDVARWKWNAGQAIHDPAREQALLADMIARGKEKGLKADDVESFFTAQMRGARQLQEAAFTRWKRGQVEKLPPGPELVELRSRIDRINGEMLDLLPEAIQTSTSLIAREYWQSQGEKILSGEEINEEIRKTVLEPFVNPQ